MFIIYYVYSVNFAKFLHLLQLKIATIIIK